MSDLGYLKTELPKPRPLATPTSQRFWHALSDERVEIQRCAECQASDLPPGRAARSASPTSWSGPRSAARA